MSRQQPERVLERFIVEHPEIIGVTRWLSHQMHLPLGILDLLGVDAGGNWMVVELKAFGDNGSALLQVCSYASQVEKICNRMYPDGNVPNIRKVVVSDVIPSVTHLSAAVELGVEVYVYCEWDGSREYKRQYPIAKTADEIEKITLRAIERINEGYPPPEKEVTRRRKPARVGEGA